MKRRRWTPWAAFAAVALGWTAVAPAAGIATFRLMNVDPEGAAPVTSVLARIIPAGSIVPRNPNTDPPSILDPSTGYVSSGFNPADVHLTLGDGTTSTGEAFQALKIDFGPNGLAPGGKLFFQLNKSAAFDGLVSLVLPTSVSNLALERLDPPPLGQVLNGSGPDTAQVPEPMSLLVWAAAMSLGLLRVRAFRRTQLAAQAA